MTDSPSLEKKIKDEKRRRSQVYNSLDYYLSGVSYFDFFSSDCFFIAKLIKWLCCEIPEKKLTTDAFLFAFLNSENEISPFLKKFNLEEKILSNLPLKKYEFLKQSRIYKFLLNFFKIKKKSIKPFPKEIQVVFEKAAENALRRFKTPIITCEILFFTLMDLKTTKAYKILKKSIPSETKWYFFRYELIKKIYKQESSIREEVSINQRYFAYLLKTQLTTNLFEKVIEDEALAKTVSIFRNTLVSRVLEENFFDHYYRDILEGMKLTTIRKYSS